MEPRASLTPGPTPAARSSRVEIVPAALVMLGAVLAGGNMPATSAEPSVLDVFRQYEKAIRTGDTRLYCSLHVAEERDGEFCRELIARGVPARKDFRVQVEGTVTRTRTAAVFVREGKGTDTQFTGFFFVREGGHWRLARQVDSNTPQHRPAFIPPEKGRFLDAGSPWDRVAEKVLGTSSRSETAPYTARFALDESFLYVQLTAPREFPPLGEPVASQSVGLKDFGLTALPTIKVRVTQGASSKNFVIGFDDSVKSRTQRGSPPEYSMTYSLTLSPEGDTMLFWQFADRETQLIRVEGSRMTARVPRESLTSAVDAALTIELGTHWKPESVAPTKF